MTFVVSAAEKLRFKGAIKKAKAELRQEVTDVFKGYVTVAFNMLVDETPQWTGHAAAQWNIGVNRLDMSTSSLFAADRAEISGIFNSGKKVSGELISKKLKYKAHPTAVNEARERNSDKVLQIALDKVIFLSNNAVDTIEGAYAQKLEENPGNYLRRVNRPGHMVMRTVSWFNSRMALLSEAQQKQLAVAKLSDSGVMEML
jgi:hypothetical protein